MSALDRPAEVLLVALFDAAGKAEAAVAALLRRGLHADDVALLARESGGAALGAVPPSAVFRLAGLGRVVARGSLALELSSGPAAASGDGRLGIALRRAGLSATDVPPLEHAVRADRVLVLAAVPRGDPRGCGRVLQRAGALSLSARLRLDPWPSASLPLRSGGRAAPFRSASPSRAGRSARS